MKHVNFVPANMDVSSTRVPRDRFLEDQSEVGEFRARRIARTRVWDFNLIWEYRSLAEVQHVEAVWGEILQGAFTFDWYDGKRYEARFLRAPQSSEQAYKFYRIEITIVGRLAR